MQDVDLLPRLLSSKSKCLFFSEFRVKGVKGRLRHSSFS